VLPPACSHHRLCPFLLPMSFILSVDSFPLCSTFLVDLHFVSMFLDGLLLYSQPLMYLNCLARLVADYRSFPRVSLSSLRALKPSSLLKPQHRFSATEQIRIRLVYEDPPWFAYPTSSHLHPSSIVFISLMRDLILIGLIISLFFYTSSVLRSWALPPIFSYFPSFYFTLSVTCSPLVPSRAARTATKSPDKSPDGSPDHSAVNYHMPSFRSPQHSAVSPFNLL